MRNRHQDTPLIPSELKPSTARVVLALSCAAQFMVVLDVSVVNVALPSIQAALEIPTAHSQWVVNAYALVLAGFLLLGGRLADVHGRKRMFLLGLVVFSAASLVGGLATSPEQLIAARAVQGLGAAVLTPCTLTVLTTTFPEGAWRTRALAIWTAVGVAGGAAGNLLGGVLTQYLSWRWILLINVPIGVVAVGVGAVFLSRHPRSAPRVGLDIPGAVLATTGLTALAYGITHTGGVTEPATVVAVAGGILALALFAVVQTRWARAPLMPPRLLRLRAVALGNIVMLLGGACFVPMWYFLSLFMQHIWHFGALRTGIGFLPHTVVTMVVGARWTPWLMRYVPGRTLITVGAVVAAIGFLWQSQVNATSDYLSGMLGPGIVLSIGGGLLTTPITTTVTSGIPASEAGAASGLMNTTKQVGGALGLASLVALSATADPVGVDYGRAFFTIAVILVVVAVVALCLPTHRQTQPEVSEPTERDHQRAG